MSTLSTFAGHSLEYLRARSALLGFESVTFLREGSLAPERNIQMAMNGVVVKGLAAGTLSIGLLLGAAGVSSAYTPRYLGHVEVTGYDYQGRLDWAEADAYSKLNAACDNMGHSVDAYVTNIQEKSRGNTGFTTAYVTKSADCSI
jgi:hypothetical protein